MYQFDSKSKLQSEKSKENTPATNKKHLQIEAKMPVQTKSLYSFLRGSESGIEQKTDHGLPAPTHAKLNNTGIPTQMKERFENHSGFSFDDVKVHYNSEKPAQLQALAYTQGNQVYVAPGQERHLEHELGHVVQQKQGRVKRTAFAGGLPVNDDPKLERDADTVLNEGIIQYKTTSRKYEASIRKTREQSYEGSAPNVIQRLKILKESGQYSPVDDDVSSCTDTLNLKLQDLAELGKWASLGIYILDDSIDSQIRYIVFKSPAKRAYLERVKEDKEKSDVEKSRNVSGILFDSGLPDVTSTAVNEDTEAGIAGQVDRSGGAAYDKISNRIFLNKKAYKVRTLLHELGHFKQFLNPDLEGVDTRDTRSKINLVDMHNIVLHENMYPSTEMPISPDNQNSYQQSAASQRWFRIYYSSSKPKAQATKRTAVIKVKEDAKPPFKRLAEETLSGLESSMYPTDIREMIQTHLKSDSPDFFE